MNLRKKGSMNTAATQKVELHQAINRIPENKLEAAKIYLHSLAQEGASNEAKKGSLEGIWEGTGLEKLDFETELKKLRTEMSEAILSRKF